MGARRHHHRDCVVCSLKTSETFLSLPQLPSLLQTSPCVGRARIGVCYGWGLGSVLQLSRHPRVLWATRRTPFRCPGCQDACKLRAYSTLSIIHRGQPQASTTHAQRLCEEPRNILLFAAEPRPDTSERSALAAGHALRSMFHLPERPVCGRPCCVRVGLCVGLLHHMSEGCARRYFLAEASWPGLLRVYSTRNDDGALLFAIRLFRRIAHLRAAPHTPSPHRVVREYDTPLRVVQKSRRADEGQGKDAAPSP